MRSELISRRDKRVSHEAVDLLLRGYRAFVAGNLAAIGAMLDPEVEWVGAEAKLA
jgi:hypothetical protein